MTTPNGDSPPAPPMPVILVRFGPQGWKTSWVDCDVHQTIAVLEQVVAKLQEEHQSEHERAPGGEPSPASAN